MQLPPGAGARLRPVVRELDILQRRLDFAGRPETVLRLLLEQPHHQGIQLRWYRHLGQLAWRHRYRLHVIDDQLDGVFGCERGSAGQHPVGHAAQVVEVRAVVRLRGAVDRLGRNVPGRAEQHAGLGELGRPLRLDLLREAEVEHLDEIEQAAALSQEDVGRLDIPVDDPARMGFGQGAQRLAQDVGDARRGQRPEALHELLEVHARQVLHRVVERVVRRSAVVEDRDRVGVREAGRELDLLLEALERSLLIHPVAADDLHGRRSAHERMVRHVNLAHTADADLAIDDVVAEPLRLHRRRSQLVQRAAHSQRDGGDDQGASRVEGQG
ncbi:MAG: hypothetical protein P8Y11_06725 [Gemmatimonadales bacterium]